MPDFNEWPDLGVPKCGYGGHRGMPAHPAITLVKSPPDVRGRIRTYWVCAVAEEFAKQRGYVRVDPTAEATR